MTPDTLSLFLSLSVPLCLILSLSLFFSHPSEFSVKSTTSRSTRSPLSELPKFRWAECMPIKSCNPMSCQSNWWGFRTASASRRESAAPSPRVFTGWWGILSLSIPYLPLAYSILQHQFSKVEMFAFTAPAHSEQVWLSLLRPSFSPLFSLFSSSPTPFVIPAFPFLRPCLHPLISSSLLTYFLLSLSLFVSAFVRPSI